MSQNEVEKRLDATNEPIEEYRTRDEVDFSRAMVT